MIDPEGEQVAGLAAFAYPDITEWLFELEVSAAF
jgi:hypothetical protein